MGNPKRNVHESWDKDRGQWKVSRERSSRASGYYDSEAEARAASQRIARNDGVEWIKHRRSDGQIHERNTYGDDPYPPKG